MDTPPMFRIWNEKTPSKKTARLSLDQAVAAAVERMHRNGGPIRFWNFKDAVWSRRFRISTADGALRFRLGENKVGQAERFKCKNGAIIRVHRVEVALQKPYDWDKLKPLAQQFYVIAATIDPDGEYGGGYVCRRASHNYAIYSTHAYGEAIDWFRSSMAKGDAIKKELVMRYGAGVTVVWRTTNHWDHLHIEMRPSRVGSPCRR